MGYRQLIKQILIELRETTGSTFVRELELCNGLSSREMGEIRAIEAELCRERPQTESGQALDYRTTTQELFEVFGVTPEEFLQHHTAELEATCESLCGDRQGPIDLDTLKFITRNIGRVAACKEHLR